MRNTCQYEKDEVGAAEGAYHEVADDVITAPLAEEGDAEDHGEPISPSLRVVELPEVPPRVVVDSDAPLLENFAILKLNKRRIGIAFTVILGEDGKSLFRPILVHKPARRLGEEHDEAHHDNGHRSLDDGRRTPSPGVLEVPVESRMFVSEITRE